jgi:hypothetical protein
MTHIEAIEEALEILSRLQLNGVVRMKDGDKLSQTIQSLHTLVQKKREI